MAIFTGAGVALITPFKEDGSVDYDKLNDILDYQIENGTDSIIITGTTGEAATMTETEHIECIRACVSHVNGRVPVIAGTGSNGTHTAIELTKEAKKAGVDGTLVVSPYYNKGTQNGLVKHFTAITKATDLPMILYNVPSRTGSNIQPKTVATLVKTVDTIVGIKEASGNISQVAEVMYETQGDIDLYSGNDDQIVPIMSLGGKGVISVLSNIAPRDTHDMVMKYLEGDIETSRKLQLKYLELINALFCEVNPIPVKKAMELMGLCGGTLRLPLTEMEKANVDRLQKAMKETGIL